MVDLKALEKMKPEDVINGAVVTLAFLGSIASLMITVREFWNWLGKISKPSS